MKLAPEPPQEPIPPGAKHRNLWLAGGVTRRQLGDRRRFRRIAKLLYVPVESGRDDLHSRCADLRPALPDDAVFSHYTAAALRGVPVPDEPQIHICTASPIEPRTRGVVGHRIQTIGEVEWFRGLPLTTPGRTYLDLAGRLDLISLVMAGDVLAQRDPAGVAGLETAVRCGGGRRGVRLARLGLPLLDPGSKSPMESRLRFHIVTDGLGRPLVNQPVYDAAGEWLCDPDLQYPQFKIAIEYEGEHHQRDPKQWQRDIRRDELLHANGWIVIKVTARDLLQQVAITLGRIRDALIMRGWRP